jgi:HEPN domain-containing protein
VLARRSAQARWGAQQAVEKTLKGLLTIAGVAFPTGGPKGHDLVNLGELLLKAESIALDHSDLTAAACSPRVRYGEELSTEAQALAANHAVLRVLQKLAEAQTAERLLRGYRSAQGGNPGAAI